MKKYKYMAVITVLVAAGFLLLRSCSNSTEHVTIETVPVGKGSISNVVSATGTLEAITTVEVGTQVSGVIEKIYVNYNSEVKKGQILAKLDQTPLVAQLEQSKASVDQAQAEADYQKANYERYKVLADKKLIAQSDYDLVVYNYHKSVASLKNAKSQYERNRINLAYATIYSPIDGIILDRAVDEGQTVAASFNTPTLFTIANDLTQMQVEASVDEADIGQIKNGQRAEFEVDAYSGRKFAGSITEIRLQPVTTSNVVTYTVVINAPNPEKELMPGMTVRSNIFVNEKTNILVIPGKAVRFTPDETLLAAWFKSQGHTPAPPAGILEHSARDGSAYVWIKKGTDLQRTKVDLGSTDGINYEMVAGLNEGDELVVALTKEEKAEVKKASAGSPFMPRPPGSRK